MCVYNVLYISISIYKISTVKKREQTQTEWTSHSQKQRAEPNHKEEREHYKRSRGTPGNAQHNTPPTVDPCWYSSSDGGESPFRTCSRFRENSRDFASFQKIHKNRRQRSRGRLTLVICVIMARDSTPPPLTKPRGGLILQGFSAAVSFPHSFTLHLCPFQLSTSPLLKNQNQDFKRFSLSNCCIYHTMACSIIIWLKYR